MHRLLTGGRVLLLVLAFVWTLASCGGDDDDTGADDTADEAADDGATDEAADDAAAADDTAADEAADAADEAADAADEAADAADEAADAADEAADAADEAADAAAEGADAAADDGAAEPTEEAASAPLRILVTNDDGVGSEGIDQVVQALLTLPDVEVTVVAPAENQSGSSDSLSETPPTGSPTTTLSGYEAIGVPGTPGDAVRYALESVFVDGPPDLIVSGSNDGQNVGEFAPVSGTVGAARIGARAGVPGVAISQAGITVEAEFEVGIPFLIEWITANRDTYGAVEGVAPVVSINAPSCGDTGEVRGAIEVPWGPTFEAGEPFEIDCSSTVTDPDDDSTALVNGFVSITLLPEDLVATSTTGS